MSEQAAVVGYSGRTLAQKMGLDKPGLRLAVVREPPGYPTWLHDVWTALDVTAVTSAAALTTQSPFDLIHLFALERKHLEADIADTLNAAAAPKGAVWLSWPKKSSGMFCDLTEDTLREVVLPLGWVDVKVAAVSTEWSGLKFLRRKVPRPKKT